MTNWATLDILGSFATGYIINIDHSAKYVHRFYQKNIVFLLLFDTLLLYLLQFYCVHILQKVYNQSYDNHNGKDILWVK